MLKDSISRWYKRLLGVIWLGMSMQSVVAASSDAPVVSGPTAHVFLLQNSGWMEPFFTDPASPYRALIAEVVSAAVESGDLLLLAAFNQSLPGQPSPKALLSTVVGERDKAMRPLVATALQNLKLAHKPNSSALADTDLTEAVSSAIHQGLKRKPGLIWLFTNNKNSPNNDQATSARNREFYQLIHRGQDISAALAFPLKMPLRGHQYQAHGLMVYVFAVQPEGMRRLQMLLGKGRLQQVLTEPAARLKPLDADTVHLAPQKVLDTPGVTFSMAGNGSLQAHVAPDARQPRATILWELQNRIYPYTIESATVTAQSQLAGEVRQVQLDHPRISKLTPKEGQPLQTQLYLPLTKLPGTWSLAALRAAGAATILPGKIELQLSEQKLALSPVFKARMDSLFPGDPLPDIFTPPADIRHSSVVLPVQVRVEYGLKPLLAALLLAAALLAAGLGAYVRLTRMRRVVYTLDGRQSSLQGSPGQRYPVLDAHGQTVAEMKFGWFGQKLVNVRQGVAIKINP